MDGVEEPRFGYPVVLDLTGVLVLVVGAGRVGARKAAGLAQAGAQVIVVAREVSPALDLGLVDEVRARPFEASDLDDVRLVVTATGDAEVDAAVAAAATAVGIWVNAADRPADCTFILPAVTRRGTLSIAVSTDGHSPALAGRLRDHASALLRDDVVTLVEDLAIRRAGVRLHGGSTEEIDWGRWIDPVLPPVAPPPTGG